MTDLEDVNALATWAVDSLGKVDILVNNAGSNEPQELVATTDETSCTLP